MIFRQDINGLRAIAVISVVVFHFFPTLLPGGFSGVDIFFVISGYLMTAIIYKGVCADSFKIMDFYLARAKRIIPALAFLCLILIIYGWFRLLPTEYKELGKHIASSITFLSNLIYWKEAGYFTTGSHEKWLLHTWSLSVEWQFYIVYPLLIIGLKRFFLLKNIRYALLGITFIFFLTSAYVSYQWAEFAYFMFPTRAWEMLAGGLVYLFPITLSLSKQKLLEWSGLFIVGSGVVLATETTAWPGFMALLPVVGTCLIMIAARQNSLLTSNAVMQQLGKISYSVYLWHWPIVVQLSYLGFSDNIFYGMLGVLLSIIFGFISYVLIEKKSSLFFPLNTIKKSFFIVMPIVVSCSVILYLGGVTTSLRVISQSPQANFIAEYKHQHESLGEDYWLKCNAYKSLLDKGNTLIDPTCISKSGDGGLLLWGDSHAEALSLGLRTYLPKGIPFYQITSAGCKPSFEQSNMRGELKQACDASNKLAISKIAELQPKIVIVAQANQHQDVDWSSFYERVHALGVETVVLSGPLPQWLPSLPIVIAKRHWSSSEHSIIDSSLDKSIVITNEFLNTHLHSDGMIFIDVFSQLCKASENQFSCLVKMDDDSLIAVDYGHLSKAGSKYVVSKIIQPVLIQYY
ncbi:acyltransferase family protein [Shewanella baltica]|uniref:acyltransferase family protein n=1 Tax=Shewanella baltica TaxID=62322 RepID=UPI0039AEC9D1